MKKTLDIIHSGDDKLRLKIEIHLNEMRLTIEKKMESMEIDEIYSDIYNISMDTEIDEIFNEFYNKFLKLKDIENYWSNNFKGATVIELNED